MGLLDRLSRRQARPPEANASLAADARSMRDALDALRHEVGASEVTLRGAVRDMLEGEIEAPTADVRALRERGTNPDEFYSREIAPSWDDLNEAQRAARLD